MGRDRESLQRQVALVSYGSSFLRNKLALNDWYQHEIFVGAPQQFRDRGNNALLAGDIPLWLANLAQGGATRLSLHPVEALGIEAPPALGESRQVVAVHYPDRYQLWAAGVEQAAWKAGDHSLLNAAAYAGEVDCYVCVDERPGQLDLPHTDWKKLAAAIAADLEMPVPSGSVPAAEHPLFVATDADSLAHDVLATLDRAQAKFENDTHPKNENSNYQYLDEESAAAVDHWGARLNKWIREVLLRAANIEGGSAVRHEDEPLVRLVQAQHPPKSVAASAPAEPVSQAPATGKWVNRAGVAIAFVVLSVLVVAIAHIIARFPWLAVLIVLPWVLYIQQKK